MTSFATELATPSVTDERMLRTDNLSRLIYVCYGSLAPFNLRSHRHVANLPLPSSRQQLSYDDCLKDKTEIIRTVLCVLQLYKMICTHIRVVLLAVYYYFSFCMFSFLF